jgi:cold shock CspA family protein
MSSQTDTATSRLLGQVKWFNNKAGYGFITLNEGDSSKDIFVHYKNVRADSAEYKYLVQGEYVEFSIVKSTQEGREFQASEVTGVKGGKLMCETRASNFAGAAATSSTGDDRRRRPLYRNTRPPRRDQSDAPAEGGRTDDFRPVERRRPTRPYKKRTEGSSTRDAAVDATA